MEYSIIEKKKTKLSIIIAEQGILHEYPIYKFFQKNAIFFQEFIEKEFTIPKIDQIILRESDGRQLSANTKLEDFISNDGTTILYVFNRMFYRTETNINDNELLLANTVLQKKWSESSYQFASASYEGILGKDVAKFLGNEKPKEYDNLTSIFTEIRNNFGSLKESSHKLKLQKNAVNCAKNNTKNYYSDRKKFFQERLRELDHKIKSFEPYLNNFDHVLDKLKTTPVDDFFKTENRSFLIDFFNSDKIKFLKENSIKWLQKIENKSNEIKKEISHYDTSLNAIEDNIPSAYEKVKDHIGEVENQFYNEVFNLHLERFRMLIEEKGISLAKKDVINFFQVEHDLIQAKITELKENIEKINLRIHDNWVENIEKQKEFIRDIAQIQVIIKEKFTNKLKAFSLLVERYEKEMFAIKLLETFPNTYEKAINEIKRRTHFKTQYLTLLKMLEKFENSENEARKSFIDIYGQFLPDTFCPFLSRYFPHLNLDLIKNALDSDQSIMIKDPNSSGKNDSSEFIKLINEIYKTIENKDNQLKDKESSLKEKDNRIAQLKSEINELKEKHQNQNTYHISINNLQKYQNFLEDSLSYNQEILLEKVKDKLHNLQNRINHCIQFSEAINQVNLKQLNMRVLNMHEEANKQLNNKDKLIETNIACSNEKISHLETSLLVYKAKEESLNKSLEEKEKQIDLLKDTITQYLPNFQPDIEGFTHLKDYFSHIIQEKKYCFEENMSLKDQIYNLQNELILNKEEVAGSKISNQEKDIIIEDLTRKLKNEILEKEEIQRCLTELKSVNQGLQSMLTKLENNEKQLNEETTHLDKKIAYLYKEINQLKTQISLIDKEKKELYDSNEENKKSIEHYKQIQHDLINEQEHNAILLNDCNDKIRQFEIDFGKLTQKIKDHQTENSSLKQEITHLNSRYQNENFTLTQEIDRLNKELITMKSEINDVNASIQENNILKQDLENLGNSILEVYALINGELLYVENDQVNPIQLLDVVKSYILKRIEDDKAKLNQIKLNNIDKDSLVLCLPTQLGHYFIPIIQAEDTKAAYFIGDEEYILKESNSTNLVKIGRVSNITEISYNKANKILLNYGITDKSTKIKVVEISDEHSIPYLGLGIKSDIKS